MFDKKYMIIEPAFTMPISVRDFYANRDTHFYALPTQRSYVWKSERQSKLIQSLILRYPIGDLTVHQGERDSLEFMDGQQRGNTIDRFYDGKIRLSKDLENVAMTDPRTGEIREFVLANKTYDDLDFEVRYLLDTRMIDVKKFRNLSDEQINEMIFRLNNGKMLTTIEKTRMLAHGDVQNFVSEISHSDLFDIKIDMTGMSKDNHMDEMIIYRILLLELNLEDEISMSNIQRIGLRIKQENLLTKEIRNKISQTMDIVNEVFPTRHKMLSYRNFISTYLFIKEIYNENTDPRKIFNLLDKFYNENNFESLSEAEKTSRANTKAIESRLEILENYYLEHIEEIDGVEK